MKILVLTEAYPDLDGNKKMNYVHERNKKYLEADINVVVLSFSTKTDYSLDGIRVISKTSFAENCLKFSLDRKLVCHAPNIKHHYLFLKKYIKMFKQVYVVFHGHEILRINKYYPAPFHKVSKKRIALQDAYDQLKIFLWKNMIVNKKNHIFSIFVSNYLKKSFLIEAGLTEIVNSKVINNSVGTIFEKESYIVSDVKEFDFITIRNHLDNSTYCLDIIYELARKFPNFIFLVIGKGVFLQNKTKLMNVVWIEKELNHLELVNYINRSKYALMPTRHDSQGVMSCEMATFGIPLLTSNIEVCKEIFDGFENVYLINNIVEDFVRFINENLKCASVSKVKNETYFSENTVFKEIKLLKNQEDDVE